MKLFRKVRNHLHYQTVLRSAVNKYVNVNKTDVLKENMMAQATVLHRAMHKQSAGYWSSISAEKLDIHFCAVKPSENYIAAVDAQWSVLG